MGGLGGPGGPAAPLSGSPAPRGMSSGLPGGAGGGAPGAGGGGGENSRGATGEGPGGAGRAPGGKSGSGAGKGATTYTRPITWPGLVIVLGIMFWFYQQVFLKKKQEVIAAIPKQGAVGRAAVGGPFELLDAASGRPFTDRDLLGHFALIYFGFTFCPDICPDELDKITEGIDTAEKQNPQVPVTPVFISIDPERDTPDVVNEYLADFHPRFVGLTGTPEQGERGGRPAGAPGARRHGPDRDAPPP